jgi:hypothetical protein
MTPISAAPAAAEMRSALVGSSRTYVETAAICGWIRSTTASACSRSFWTAGPGLGALLVGGGLFGGGGGGGVGGHGVLAASGAAKCRSIRQRYLTSA